MLCFIPSSSLDQIWIPRTVLTIYVYEIVITLPKLELDNWIIINNKIFDNSIFVNFRLDIDIVFQRIIWLYCLINSFGKQIDNINELTFAKSLKDSESEFTSTRTATDNLTSSSNTVDDMLAINSPFVLNDFHD